MHHFGYPAAPLHIDIARYNWTLLPPRCYNVALGATNVALTMGTILARPNKKGEIRYTATIRKMEGKRVALRETQTFKRKQAAEAWIRKRESELDEPGAVARALAPSGTLADAIDRYTQESRKEIGRTKTQVLRSIKEYSIANMDCSTIRSEDIVAFAGELSNGREPSTVGNYISHLAAIFAIAKPAWGIPLNQDAMRDAQTVMSRLEMTSKSKQRTRRPTLEELDKLMAYFMERRAGSIPMHKITAFAIFSTRRQEEITTIAWDDFEPEHKRILVRDMKHPGQKVGNDVYVELPDEALAIIKSMPRVADEIFPYSGDTISASFTRACFMLGINTKDMDDHARLHFHDLRHDGVSRLFEMGRSIPQAASVSGHRSWQSLQRYTHLRETGDKYEGWKWLKVVTK